MEELVKNILRETFEKKGWQKYLPLLTVEVPSNKEFGDFSTSIALIIAKKEKQNPVDLAIELKDLIKVEKRIKRVDVAGPGFVNIFLDEEVYFKELKNILKEGSSYGRSEIYKNKKMNVEYVSANPTGPLHIGNSRGGPIGEVLANIFSFLGAEVCREFYVNDIGGQIDRFGESLYYWFAVKEDDRIVFPENGYPGEYVKELSDTIQKEEKEKIGLIIEKEELVQFFAREGLRRIIHAIKEDVALLGIKFDKWSYQSEFENSGKTDEIIKKLENANATTKNEGALWFANPSDPDLKDKESVLKKSGTGDYTYFADDIAYHADKFDRGFDHLIDVWGANHHGHIARIKSAMKALQYPSEKLDIILYQYVRLKKGGESVKMGKRLGNFVTLRQVIESGVSPDAFKYFILSQNPNTPFDFDIQLASDTTEKNPVFYIKYAHARICSILEKAGEFDVSKADLTLLNKVEEQSLFKEIVLFPSLMKKISDDFQLQALPHFAYRIASLFHNFYANCQVISEDKKLTLSRLCLIQATKHVIASSLNICGIEAPEKM